DIWNAYEVSWLTPKGKPVVALARFTFPHESPRLVESKSFKLYLNSFSEERFDDAGAVSRILRRDLSQAAGAEVGIELTPLDPRLVLQCGALDGASIDDADIQISTYEPAPGLLRCLPGARMVSETLVSDLLKS